MNRDTEFRDFYLHHEEAAKRYATTILGPRRLAEVPDVVQNAWIRAWRSWEDADPVRREAWFFRIVRNCSLDRHRVRREQVLADGYDVPLDVDFDGALRWDEALRLMSTLPAHLRETLWLRAVRDMSYDEIAEVLSIPVGTVMSRLHSARRKLAKRLRTGGEA